MNEVLQETQKEWQGFDKRQKLAAVAANALTLSRPVLSGLVSMRGLDKTHKWEKRDTALLGAAYLTDLEGNIARAGDAQTKIGGIADPIADKIASNSQEMVLAYRGEEHWANVAVRLGRDLGISALRKYALKETHGNATVNANWTGKANTAFRQGVIAFATSPLGEKYPRVRKTLLLTSAAATAASGIVTAYRLIKQVREYKNKS